MIGFRAGVGQMTAIFGSQTCRNELVRGERENVALRNRGAVVGSPQPPDLPASPWDKV